MLQGRHPSRGDACPVFLAPAESICRSKNEHRVEAFQTYVQLRAKEDTMSKNTSLSMMFAAIAAVTLAFSMMPVQARAFTLGASAAVYVTRYGYAYHIYRDCPTLSGHVVTSIAFGNHGSRDVCNVCEARYERSGGNSGQQQSVGWVASNGGWWYRNADGSYPTSCWQKIGGPWYRFDTEGWMQTGWLNDGGTWYYLAGSGAMCRPDGSCWMDLGASSPLLVPCRPADSISRAPGTTSPVLELW